MRSRYLPLVVSGLMLLGCDNGNSSNYTKNTSDRYLSANSTLNNDQTNSLTSILQGYFNLKNAFVLSDEEKVDIAAKSLLEELNTLNTQLKSDTSFTTHNNNIDSLISYTNLILLTKDETVELKRVPLKEISNVLYITIKDYQLKGMKVYQQYCPMAFNDNGAHWLSSSKEILNPYFGKKMLECGEVTDIIE